MISLNKKATLNVATNSPIKNLTKFFDATLLMVISRRREKPDLTFDASLICINQQWQIVEIPRIQSPGCPQYTSQEMIVK